jgi:hypothetical protein
LDDGFIADDVLSETSDTPGHAVDLPSHPGANMNKSLATFFAASLWAGVAVSSATPAHATAATSQQGTYASCSASYTATGTSTCYGIMNYTQQLRFNTTACASGSLCSAGTGTTYVTSVYPIGRKAASQTGSCGLIFYELGTCSC